MATEYISREAAIEALCKAHSPYPRRMEISVKAIQEIPPADVRPVVYCKDCKHSDAFSSDCAESTFPLKCLSVRYGGVFPLCFCEHGERNSGSDMRKVVEIDQVKEEPCEACSLDWMYKGK